MNEKWDKWLVWLPPLIAVVIGVMILKKYENLPEIVSAVIFIAMFWALTVPLWFKRR